MTKENINQEPMAEAEVELSEEVLEGVNGGMRDPLLRKRRRMKRLKEMLEKSDEPKDGGATGSW
ncbi:MAG: hypothetical protein IKG21_07445 [Atopobiaceae bacterium]|nr:hypothetical protein [Atopobiaceae bacterium]